MFLIIEFSLKVCERQTKAQSIFKHFLMQQKIFRREKTIRKLHTQKK